MSTTLPEPITLEKERAELQAVLQSPLFARSQTLAHLLSYLCEKTFAGEGDHIKEYSVAVDVRGRPDSFDQDFDSIVRVQANRLRKRLAEYYSGEGASHEMRITIPVGQYVPAFEEVTPAFAEPVQSESVQSPSTERIVRFATCIVAVFPFQCRLGEMKSLNQAFTCLSMRRRYEVWFLRIGLTNGSGAWWLRYLLMNPGLSGCAGIERGAPVQVWATWFPSDGSPQSFIQEFPLEALHLSAKQEPFLLKAGPNCIKDNSCCGNLELRGHKISWDLRYHSHFCSTLSDKGWIGFSRTPHSDAIFSGEIRLDDSFFRGEPLGLGVQGHNCGFRHRYFWTWLHAWFAQKDGSISTFESLVYEMPLGLVFRKAILWHQGQSYEFRKLRESFRDRKEMSWGFTAASPAGTIEVNVDGGGISLHKLPYTKTNCTGIFEVSNNSRARARLKLRLRDSDGPTELATEGGAVLEMAGSY